MKRATARASPAPQSTVIPRVTRYMVTATGGAVYKRTLRTRDFWYVVVTHYTGAGPKKQEWTQSAAAANMVAAARGKSATGTGTATGTSLAVTAVTSAIILGCTVTGTGVPAGTTIVSQQSGPVGGNGSYTTSVATTASAAALTFTPPATSWKWPVASVEVIQAVPG
jgi:hypothetical protein